LSFTDSKIILIVDLQNQINEFLRTQLGIEMDSLFEIYKDGYLLFDSLTTKSLLCDNDEIKFSTRQDMKPFKRDDYMVDQASLVKHEVQYYTTNSKSISNKGFNGLAGSKRTKLEQEEQYNNGKVQEDDTISVDDIQDMNKQIYGDLKQTVTEPLVNKQKKRKIKESVKERAKELQDISKSIKAMKSDSDSDSDSDSSSSSSSSSDPSPKVKSLKKTNQNTPQIKITQPKQTLKIKTPIEQFNEKKAEWPVHEGQVKNKQKVNKPESQNEGDKKYVNQFSGLPKSKLSQKLKESIIDSHLKKVNPTKPLVKGVKVTPDYYAPNSPNKSRRRNSHGNRAFSIKHKVEGQNLKALMDDYRSKGFLL
jgi:hypothetical protein